MDSVQCADCNNVYAVGSIYDGGICPVCFHDDFNFMCGECREYHEMWLYHGICPNCEVE